MQQKPFSGVLTAVATPFFKDGSLDAESFQKLVRIQKEAGVSGIIVAGTTGESPTLTKDELRILLELALRERTSAFRIYVGTGSNDTRKSIETSRLALEVASKAGIPLDGVMAVVPYYNKPTQAGLTAHFGAIAEAVAPLPLCVYNVPGRTSCCLAPATFVKIALAHQNVAALKEAAGDMNVMTELRLALQRAGIANRISLLSGDDLTFAPSVIAGAEGVISVSANIIPREMVALREALEAGDLREVRRLHQLTYPLHTSLFVAPNPVPLKWALGYLKVCQGHLRLPLVPLESAEAEPLRRALDEALASGLRLIR